VPQYRATRGEGGLARCGPGEAPPRAPIEADWEAQRERRLPPMVQFDPPPRCCAECFADDWLRTYVLERSQGLGACDYCGRANGPLIDVSKLSDAFEGVVSRFTRDEDGLGDSLLFLIQDRYRLFRDDFFEDNENRAAALLEDIANWYYEKDQDQFPVDAQHPYSTRRSKYHETIEEKWQQFSDDVRAGLKSTVGVERFEDMYGEWHDAVEGGRPFALLFADLERIARSLPADATIYRVRASFREDAEGNRTPHEGDAAGAPPANLTRNQRLSRQGDVVFYGADEEDTAIAEARPAAGYVVTLSRWFVARELRIIDLTAETPRLNPFTEESLEWWEEFFDFVRLLGEQMGRPIEHPDGQADYRPCQEAADRIREQYDGIRYPSALHPGGRNLVLFDPKAVRFGGSKLMRISRVNVSSEDFVAGQHVTNWPKDS
jgi:hypothetical protein